MDLKANTVSDGQNVREDTENQALYAEESSYDKVTLMLEDLLLNFLFQFGRKIFCSFFMFKMFCG